ncbi:hepatic lectin-like [Mizuhopecten yessoensis]|nr:hepatic lectin-like [Mizuhopecten yessoensis]
MWRRNVDYANTEFQSFLSKSTVRVLQECIWFCTLTQHCLFATFCSSTQECKLYSFLEGQVPVANTSFWKASQQCVETEDGEELGFFYMHVPFHQANRTCVSFKGHLAILDSIEKLEEFRLILNQKSESQSEKHWWIGGVNTISGWEWMNGQPMNTSRSFWAGINPSGNGECVRYGLLNKFDDVHCKALCPFVCVIDQTNCFG